MIPEGFLTVVPDLAVEIRSPTDRSGALLQKVGQWIEAGATVLPGLRIPLATLWSGAPG